MEKGTGYNTRHYCWAVAVSLCRKIWTCETAGCLAFMQMSLAIMDCAADPWPRYKDVPQISPSSIMLTFKVSNREKGKVPCKQITSSFIIWEKKIKRNVIEERRKEIFDGTLGPAVTDLQGFVDAEWGIEQQLSSSELVLQLLCSCWF